MDIKRISPIIALSLLSPLALNAASEPAAIEKSASSIRSSQRRLRHQLMTPPQLKPMGIYVGELQERWQFPSDHLPIGITYEDLHIGSWNVLDAGCMNWVLENSQGLSRSQIVDEHIYLDGSQLTFRDIHVTDLVLQMLTHPTHPRSILSLQECSRDFIQHLKSRLPDHFKLIVHHDNAMIIDQNLFEILSAEAIFEVFSENGKRSFQDVTLYRKDSNEFLRLINAHLPGDPKGPSRFEFGQYLANTNRSDLQTIAMGDMNFNEIEMRAAIRDSDLQIFSPYCTNISVSTSDHPFTSKAIDHFIISSDKKIQINSAEDLLEGLDSIALILNN